MLININDASVLLKVSLSTLRRWDSDGKLKSIRVQNSHRKYDSKDIVYILKNNMDTQVKLKKFKFIDLFAGVWWFHHAFSNLWGECVSAVEFDKNCRITYELNYYNNNKELFDKWLFFEDIREVDEKRIPNHDILCGGFPCQAFSIAWYQKWFSDERGNLFFDIERIIKEKNPSVIFLENVKNLASHDGWRTFGVILQRLKEQGYFIRYKVLNSYEYGDVPQNRERVYIVGFKDWKAYERFEFPKPQKLTKKMRDILEDDVDLSFYYNDKPLFGKLVWEMKNWDTAYQWRRQYVRENKKNLIPTLTANMGTGGHNVPLILDTKGIRKLTPRECFSAQGYPESFKLPKIANSQLYKQAGNSVSVPVLQRIGENILFALGLVWEKHRHFELVSDATEIPLMA